jgi:leader peptidase (prepilin peptidase)/N-methyltransferase
VEALTSALFVAAGYEFGLGIRLLSALVLICALIALAGIDLEHRLLPNVIVGPVSLVGFALSSLENPENWWLYPISAFAVAGGLFALAYPGGMGMGDVKLGGMLGAFLGPYAALAIFLGALCGALVGGTLMSLGRMERRSVLPFGVFMALGGIVALFMGPRLWNSIWG